MLTCTTVAARCVCVVLINQPLVTTFMPKWEWAICRLKLDWLGRVKLCLLSGQMLNFCVLSLIRPVFELSSSVCFRTLCSVIEQQANDSVVYKMWCDVMCMKCVVWICSSELFDNCTYVSPGHFKAFVHPLDLGLLRAGYILSQA